jgi:transposase-like protein
MAKTIRHAEQTKEKYHEVKSGCAYVKCVCPRCDKVYKRMIQWSGHGMPRYYCNNCRMDVENDTTGMVSIMTIDTGWTDHWYKEADDDK